MGENAKKGSGGPQSGGNFLPVSHTYSAPIWIGDLVVITGNSNGRTRTIWATGTQSKTAADDEA